MISQRSAANGAAMFLVAAIVMLMAVGSAAGDPQKAGRPAAEQPTPESVAQLYFDDLKAGRYGQMADRMHPEALASFKNIMVPIAEAAADSGAWEQLAFLCDEIDSVEQLRDASPKKVFVAFFTSFVKVAPQVQSIFEGAKADLIGHVREDDMAHVIARLKASVNEVEVTKMIVISLGQTDEGWGVLLSAEIDGFAQSLKRRFL